MKGGQRTGADLSLAGGSSRQSLEEVIRARDAAGNHMMSFVGIGLAVTSVAFAAYAIIHGAGFSSLPNILPAMTEGVPVNKSLASHARRQNVMDPTTTGALSVRTEMVDARQRDGRTRGASYVIYRVFGETALVEGVDGLHVVVPGAVLPGVGRVLSIERTGGSWSIVTSETVIGEASL
ncbi:hypothetical protein [Microvirga subterranea]|uniref:Uncharacterized protein n=1 Tax=Microvirga subterranea TaxID=186651 RepID=A0A370HSF9_9HYPH|nr:hypothetical protein [Microvirga subterranea]RDI61255.1 hypothetical protein DES45_102650 [Microvirga subterranea]